MTTLGRPRKAANRMDSRRQEGGFLPQLSRLATLSEKLFPHRSRLRSSPSTRTRAFAPQSFLGALAPPIALCATRRCPEFKELKPGPASFLPTI